jgi:hypothetical protein
MPAPPTIPTDRVYDLVHWDEVIDKAQPGGAQTFTETQQSAALIAHIDKPLQKESFLRQTLGHAWADDAAPWRLRRHNPIRHPEHPHLFASRVGFTDRGPAGNPARLDKLAKRDSIDSTLPVNKFAYYTSSTALVDFLALPYNFVDDGDYGEYWYVYEHQRNVDFEHEYSAQTNIISAETGRHMEFLEGPPNGETFPGEVGEYLQKASITWKWYNVPREYIFNPFGIPKKIIDGLGKVNDDTFEGWDKQTLLFSTVNFEKFLYPWVVDDGAKRPAFGYNVTFVMSHFDPEPGVAMPVFRGHNLFPWTSSKYPAVGSVWFSAARPNGDGYIGEYDFQQLFKHVGAP